MVVSEPKGNRPQFPEDEEMQEVHDFGQGEQDGQIQDGSRLLDQIQKVPFYIQEQLERNKRLTFKKKL